VKVVKIALIQQECSDDKKNNQEKGLQAVKSAVEEGAQIICFAELAFEPFYPQVPAKHDVLALAEPVPGLTTEIFSKMAKEYGVVIVLNLFERDGSRTYDTSPVIDSDGRILGKTRMVHITDYPHFHEQGYYHAGDRGAAVYDTAFGKIGVAICYDRHFPEYMRALALGGAQIVFTPQAGAVGEWPEGLFEAEMRVAAFQNGYFTALCNRVGAETKLTFAGESFVCDPMGKVIARAGLGSEEILFCELDLELIEQAPARKLFFRDRRPELYKKWFTYPEKTPRRALSEE
jgi:N-carbamoylputrescine amidase